MSQTCAFYDKSCLVQNVQISRSSYITAAKDQTFTTNYNRHVLIAASRTSSACATAISTNTWQKLFKSCTRWTSVYKTFNMASAECSDHVSIYVNYQLLLSAIKQ